MMNFITVKFKYIEAVGCSHGLLITIVIKKKKKLKSLV